MLRSLLSVGDRRSIGHSDQVAESVVQCPNQVGELIECLLDPNECIRMRAADAMEKVSRHHVSLIQPFKKSLIQLFAQTTQKEVRWHLALTVPRLELTPSECQRAAGILEAYLEDASSIVKTCAMQGLSDLTAQNTHLFPKVLDLIRTLTNSGTPAMRARGRILLRKLSPG